MILLNNKTELLFDCSNNSHISTLELKCGESLNSENLPHNILLFILSGEIKITYNEFIRYTLSSNRVIHFTKSGRFICKILQDTSIIIFAYSVPKTICDRSNIQNLSKYLTSKKKLLPSITIPKLIQLFLKDIIRYDNMEAFSEYPKLHEIKGMELFILFRTQFRKENLAVLFSEIISDSFVFKDKVLQYYTKAKTVQELGDLCGYSKKTFSRLFKTHFNITPHKWLQTQKSKLIPAYIAHNPNDSLITISDKFGFSSLSHFNSFCRTHYGLSAKSFRVKVLSEKIIPA